MEYFGAAAAGVALVAELGRLSRSLKKAIKKIRHAPAEAETLTAEIDMFRDLYYQLLETDVEKDGRATSATKRLEVWSQDAIRGFQQLLGRVKALRGGPRYSILETLTARLQWYLNESAVKCLRASLSVARQTINCFLNIRAIEYLSKILEELRSAVTEEGRREVETRYDMNSETARNQL
jgi:hypothetical protein